MSYYCPLHGEVLTENKQYKELYDCPEGCQWEITKAVDAAHEGLLEINECESVITDLRFAENA